MNVTRALRALKTKRETLPPKKHGNISTELATSTLLKPAPPYERRRPVIRIVRGNPSAEEIAALVAVLAGSAARAVPTSHHARTAGRRRPPGSGHPHTGRDRGWRASALPR